jgi:hypothetical protein
MRTTLSPLVFAIALSIAPAAFAGGAWCQNQSGDSVRCRAPGAMPIGWTAAGAGHAERPIPSPTGLGTILGLIGAIGGLFVLIALMPEFQDRSGGWDEQQVDAGEEPG